MSILLLSIVFICIRLPGTSLPLHQDEYKWPDIANPAHYSEVGIPHPPLSEFIYRTAGYIVGYDTDFRFVPLFFGTINLVLLYYFMRIVWGRREAVIACLIWIFSYFSVLASLMVDTDGQVMPFFFLIALISYYKIRPESSYTRNFSWKWLGILILACLGGFLVKVSFLLAVAAIFADFLWLKKNIFDRKIIIKYVSYGLSVVIGLIIILFLMKYIFPFFNLDKSLKYWLHFISADRGWFQTIIQCIKALLYASPFLVLVPFLNKKQDISLARPFVFFLVFSFIFYIVLFDFSIGALDRYLQLIILPLTVFCAIAVSYLLKIEDKYSKKYLKISLIAGLLLVLIFILLQFVYHYVPTLHPKTEWISRIISFRWNFVYPFSGGSGPLGFYVSFLFMALSWLTSLIAVILGIWKPAFRKFVLIFLIPIGIAYNGVFIEEYIFGVINGSASRLLINTVEFIKNDTNIIRVNPYNDNGGNEIREIGKYGRRLYIDPKFETDPQSVLDNLNLHKEHYLVINIPRFSPDSVQQRFFDTCRIVYMENDKKISSVVYDCRRAPDIKKQKKHKQR